MANTLEADIIRILSETRDKIRANMDAQKVNASGRTSASIRVEPYEGGVKLVGGTDSDHKIEDYPAILGTLDASDTAPIPTLEVGRVGGNVPRVLLHNSRVELGERFKFFQRKRARYVCVLCCAKDSAERYKAFHGSAGYL